jgi:hypothetical protein
MVTMRGKISCSAQRLSLLEPSMVQSVVEPPAFQIANQYLAENRVRIVEADECQISSVVIGNSGVYDQTVRLKDGTLATKCTCTLNEQPFCRHSVAVLLEYHRWVSPKNAPRTPDRPANGPPAPRPGPSTPTLDIKLGEITAFVEWLQAVVKALEGGHVLPSGPNIKAGEVFAWITAIQRLDDRRRFSEEKQRSLEADLRDRDDQLSRLNLQLQTTTQEGKETRAKVENLEREIAGHAVVLTRVVELAKDIDRFDGQVKTLATELLQKASLLDRLGTSCKEISTALQSVKPNSR